MHHTLLAAYLELRCILNPTQGHLTFSLDLLPCLSQAASQYLVYVLMHDLSEPSALMPVSKAVQSDRIHHRHRMPAANRTAAVPDEVLLHIFAAVPSADRSCDQPINC